jgi:hypothetical protein
MDALPSRKPSKMFSALVARCRLPSTPSGCERVAVGWAGSKLGGRSEVRPLFDQRGLAG